MTTLANLEGFIAAVKSKAKHSVSFTQFEAWARQLNYKPFMASNEFDRLISVASVEAGLENTD